MLHAFAIEPSGQIFRNLTRSIAAQKPRPVRNGDVIKAPTPQASCAETEQPNV